MTLKDPSALCVTLMVDSASVVPTWWAGTVTRVFLLHTSLDPAAAEVTTIGMKLCPECRRLCNKQSLMILTRFVQQDNEDELHFFLTTTF